VNKVVLTYVSGLLKFLYKTNYILQLGTSKTTTTKYCTCG